MRWGSVSQRSKAKQGIPCAKLTARVLFLNAPAGELAGWLEADSERCKRVQRCRSDENVLIDEARQSASAISVEINSCVPADELDCRVRWRISFFSPRGTAAGDAFRDAQWQHTCRRGLQIGQCSMQGKPEW